MRQDRLLRLREDRGMTRADLSEKSGVALASIGFYERGEREPGADSLEKICKALNVSADYLLGLADHRNGSQQIGNQQEEKQPAQLMADLLAEMVERAAKAERQRDEARQSSDEWYQNWQRKDAELKETQAKLSAEIEEHQRTRDRLREALENKAKGVQENG